MSEETAEKKDGAAEEKSAKGGKGALGGIVGIVLTAVVAAGGAFGGAKIAAAHAAGAAAPAPEPKKPMKAPGPTLTLQPFLVITNDAEKHPHPVKITLAIEFEQGAKEEEVKELTPRIRDAVLTFLRGTTYEELTDSKIAEKTRDELLEKIQKSGASDAERILITDFVVQ